MKIEIKLVEERRRQELSKRKSIFVHANCTNPDGSTCVVRLRNLSETGLGGLVMEGLAPLSNQVVTIVIGNSHRIRGHAIWLHGKQVGIAFEQRFDMSSLADAWKGPGFEVRDMHKVGARRANRPPVVKSKSEVTAN